MTIERIMIARPSLPLFIQEVVEKALEGYEVDYEKDYPSESGIMFTCSMTKDVEAPSETPVKPPVDRAAIMAKARAAKGINKQSEQNV